MHVRSCGKYTKIISFIICTTIIITILATPCNAARDQIITSGSDQIWRENFTCFSFRYAGASMCLNQLCSAAPINGTNLTGYTVPTNGTNATQWYQLFSFYNQYNNVKTEGHGYVCYANKTVCIYRRDNITNSYVNVKSISTAIMGNSDVRWACDNDYIYGISHYIGCSNLDLTSYSTIGSYAESAVAGTYLKWIDGNVAAAPFEWERYNELTGVWSTECGCYITNTGYHYLPY